MDHIKLSSSQKQSWVLATGPGACGDTEVLGHRVSPSEDNIRDPVCSKAALDSSIAPCIEIYQQRRSEASSPSLPGPQGNYGVIDPFLSFARMIIKQLMSVSNHIVSCFKFMQ